MIRKKVYSNKRYLILWDPIVRCMNVSQIIKILFLSTETHKFNKEFAFIKIPSMKKLILDNSIKIKYLNQDITCQHKQLKNLQKSKYRMHWKERHIKNIWKLCRQKRILNQKKFLKGSVKKQVLMIIGKILFLKEEELLGESEHYIFAQLD